MEKHFFMEGDVAGLLPREIGWLGPQSVVVSALADSFSHHGYRLISADSADELLSCRCLLVLFDCTGQEVAQVRERLLALHHLQNGVPVALLGVGPGSPYEQFVRWPAVRGIFPSECSELHLLRGVESILQGQNWLPRRLLEQWLERQRIQLPLPGCVQDSLTGRERQILKLVGDAATNAQVAYELRISEHTVKTHLYNIFRKIRVRNRTEASNWARANFCEVEV